MTEHTPPELDLSVEAPALPLANAIATLVATITNYESNAIVFAREGREEDALDSLRYAEDLRLALTISYQFQSQVCATPSALGQTIASINEGVDKALEQVRAIVAQMPAAH